MLNAPADARAAGEPDPLVAPPIYGCWPAQVERVSAAEGGWVNELNLDPRTRAAAGLGARVIREHQEEYMRLAWEQIGEVLTVNHKIRRLQLATKAAAAAYIRTLSPLPGEGATVLMAPTFAMPPKVPCGVSTFTAKTPSGSAFSGGSSRFAVGKPML